MELDLKPIKHRIKEFYILPAGGPIPERVPGCVRDCEALVAEVERLRAERRKPKPSDLAALGYEDPTPEQRAAGNFGA